MKDEVRVTKYVGRGTKDEVRSTSYEVRGIGKPLRFWTVDAWFFSNLVSVKNFENIEYQTAKKILTFILCNSEKKISNVEFQTTVVRDNLRIEKKAFFE